MKDLKYYIDKPIQRYLDDHKNYLKTIITDSKPGLASSLMVVYPSDTIVELSPVEFKIMKQFDVSRKWNIEEFRKEKIGRIEVYYNNKLVEKTNHD